MRTVSIRFNKPSWNYEFQKACWSYLNNLEVALEPSICIMYALIRMNGKANIISHEFTNRNNISIPRTQRSFAYPHSLFSLVPALQWVRGKFSYLCINFQSWNLPEKSRHPEAFRDMLPLCHKMRKQTFRSPLNWVGIIVVWLRKIRKQI